MSLVQILYETLKGKEMVNCNCLSFYFQIASVDRFVHHVNSTLRQQHEEEKLQAIVDKIESYDAIEAPNDECLKV